MVASLLVQRGPILLHSRAATKTTLTSGTACEWFVYNCLVMRDVAQLLSNDLKHIHWLWWSGPQRHERQAEEREWDAILESVSKMMLNSGIEASHCAAEL